MNFSLTEIHRLFFVYLYPGEKVFFGKTGRTAVIVGTFEKIRQIRTIYDVFAQLRPQYLVWIH